MDFFDSLYIVDQGYGRDRFSNSLFPKKLWTDSKKAVAKPGAHASAALFLQETYEAVAGAMLKIRKATLHTITKKTHQQQIEILQRT